MPGPQDRRPTRADIDVAGVTDRGRVRTENQDQYIIASVHRTLTLLATSLDPDEFPDLRSPTRGYIIGVADGVGSGEGGRASRLALRGVAEYVTTLAPLWGFADIGASTQLEEEMREAALHAHDLLRAELDRVGTDHGLATTLTLVAVLWPAAFLVHVGDSRCYRLRDGVLELLSRDQTVAGALEDAGTLTPDQAARSPLRHVLASALGSREALPQTRMETCHWSDRLVLCTDGLTKHVDEAEIAAALASDASSAAIAQELVGLALARGGTDNVTVVVGRLRS